MPITKEGILRKHTYSNILPLSKEIHAAMDEWATIQTAERDAEIERLKGLIETEFKKDCTWTIDDIEKEWQEYKIKNNL